MKLPGYMLRTPVVLRRATGQLNGVGEPTRADVPIRVGWRDVQIPTRNKRGEQVVSSSIILCPVKVAADDVFVKDGREHVVIEVKEIADDVTHKPVYWEVRA